MMASGKSAKKRRSSSSPLISKRQGLPWLTIIAVVVIVGLAAGIFTVVLSKNRENEAATAAVQPFIPTAENKDPSTAIQGIFVGASTTDENGALSYTDYKAALHVSPTQRVAYDRFPPVGGPHDAIWAACNGVVYAVPVRDENMVHTMEHGAVWITYNPDTIAAGDLDVLKGLVEGQTYITLSPYPNLDTPVSLQSWGHQLKVDSASDERVKQFITALRLNPYTYPEIGATCSQPSFDTANPPAFDGSPRDADAVPMDGAGLTTATDEPAATDAATPTAAPTSPATDPTSGAQSPAATESAPATSGS
ncbi:DUF3105 domain-containing protein [Nakamurella flavida]